MKEELYNEYLNKFLTIKRHKQNDLIDKFVKYLVILITIIKGSEPDSLYMIIDGKVGLYR